MERRILEAEAAAAAAQTTLAEASAAGDGTRIAAGLASLRTAEAEVERLYARWAELEAKLASG